MTIDEKGSMYHTTKVYSFVFNNEINEDIKYFLGILNSKLLWFFLSSTGYILHGGYFTFKTQYLNNFPIRIIDLKNNLDKSSYEKIIMLVEQMLSIQKQYQSENSTPIKTNLKQKINILDNQIDQLVYELYGLTEEEIKVVEESVK
jgi:hypothetical protein